MASLNLTQFIGNVGSIETKYLPSGEGVTNISLAVNDRYKNKSGELVDSTEWVRISFFGKLSEIAEKYVKKGDPIYVSGQMKTRKWTDKNGAEKYSTEIRGDRLQLLGGKGDAHSEPKSANSTYADSTQAAMKAQAPTDSPSTRGGASGFDDMDDDLIPF